MLLVAKVRRKNYKYKLLSKKVIKTLDFACKYQKWFVSFVHRNKILGTPNFYKFLAQAHDGVPAHRRTAAPLAESMVRGIPCNIYY